MNNYYIRKLIDSDQLNEIDSLIEYANETEEWDTGLTTAKGMGLDLKKNYELKNSNTSERINQIIMNCLDNDEKFINLTSAKSTTFNIISKTISGGYYKPHIDMWSNGDYSTTVFLNNPDEYSGGELCLFLNDNEEKIKLKKGYAITYPTGIMHRVNRVISGKRYVSVFWTKSSIKDDFIRGVSYELYKAMKNLNNKSMHHMTCDSLNDDTYFILHNLRNQILRKYSID